MSSHRPHDPEHITTLISGFLDGSLNDEQLEELETLLRSDPSAVTQLVSGSVLRENLRCLYRQFNEDAQASAIHCLLLPELEATGHLVEEHAPVQGSAKLSRKENTIRSDRRAWMVRASWALATIAASLFIALLVLPDRSSEFAMVTQLVAVNDCNYKVGARLGKSDHIEITSGLVEVTFDNGTVVALKGPASFEVLSDLKARVDRGNIAVEVGQEVDQFTVITPTADVIDLGTMFGIGVQGEETDVVVFDGEVDLRANGLTGVQPKRMTQGDALRVNSKGEMHRIVSVASSEFPTPNSLHFATANPVIAGVSDNIRDGTTSKCYRIVRAGFQEDALAYVDRSHEWNGLADSGLPRFLLGGDYIMPFNEDKRRDSLQVEVTFAQDANVYVLLDQRATPPNWLVSQYEDMKTAVGLDEGPSRMLPKIATSDGPAKSIDNEFSVWRGTARAGEVLTFGSIEDGTQPWKGLAMYAIVATPLIAN